VFKVERAGIVVPVDEAGVYTIQKIIASKSDIFRGRGCNLASLDEALSVLDACFVPLKQGGEWPLWDA